MYKDKALVVFQGKKIRRIWFSDEWWFLQFLFVEFFMHYENKRSTKGIVKIDGAELEWKGEPAFILEKGKG